MSVRNVKSMTTSRLQFVLQTVKFIRTNVRWNSRRAVIMWSQFHDKIAPRLNTAMSIVMHSEKWATFVDLTINSTSLSATWERKIVENTSSSCQSNVASLPSNSRAALPFALLNMNRYAEVTENLTLMSASLHKSAAEREISSQKHTWDHVADPRSHPQIIYIRLDD